jgi:NADH-quinone oxidoreductase subunit M
MRIAIAPLVLTVLFVLGGAATSRVTRPREARRTAIQWATANLIVALVAILIDTGTLALNLPVGPVNVQWFPEGLLKLAPVVTSMIGLTIVAMSPVASHPPRTLGRILFLLATASAFLAFNDPLILTALWASSALIGWFELRAEETSANEHAIRIDRLFAIYHLPSVVFFATGVLCLHFNQTGVGILALLAGIAIREAVMPAHSWFPTFVERAPLGVVVAFSAPQLGVYAQLQILTQGLSTDLAFEVAAAGVITAIAAAALGLVQRDARRALAFLMMSQTGLVAFGLENRTSVALTGALLTWQVLALATTGFAMTLSALESRRGSLSLQVSGGNFARTPRLAVALLFLGFSTVGFPLTLGFVAEDLLVQGSVGEYSALGLGLILATTLNGITVMRCFLTLFSGSRIFHGEQDLRGREIFALSVAILALLAGGLFPGPLVKLETVDSGTAVEIAAGHH